MGATAEPRPPIVLVRTASVERSNRVLPDRSLRPATRHSLERTLYRDPPKAHRGVGAKTDESGVPIQIDGADPGLSTRGNWSRRHFSEEELLGIRQNLRTWINLRNSVAHRHLPPLDYVVIPHAQAALLNFENTVVREFGPALAIAERLSVPLQLSGFREPGVLASRKKLQASLPSRCTTPSRPTGT